MDQITKSEIKDLLNENNGPCLTMLMPAESSAGEAVEKMKIQFKNLYREARNELRSWDIEGEEADEFLHPLENLLNDRDFWLEQSRGLAILKSQKDFKIYRLPLKFEPKIKLEKYFYISPLIPEIFSEKRFFLLAVSRKSCRFFQGTPQEIELVEIADMPESLDEVIADDDRQSSTQQHSASRGGTSVIHHGHDERDQKVPARLIKYLNEVYDSLNDHLQEQNFPLFVMCVKELFPHIKKVFDYKGLQEKFIQGSPDRLAREEILDKSFDVIQPHFKKPHEEIRDQYMELKNTKKTSAELEEILSASRQGRVDTLLLNELDEPAGIFDQEENRIKTNQSSPESYSLPNLAAVNTLKTGGQIFLLTQEEMPNNADICAIYRY